MSSDESETDFANVNLSELLDFTDSDNSSDEDIANYFQKERGKNLISSKLDEVNQLQIEKRLSYQATSSVVKLMNGMPSASIKLPTSTTAIRKYSSDKIKFKFLIKCEECDDFVEHGVECGQCKRILRKDSKKNNFLVYMNSEPQIRLILNRHFKEIINHLNREHIDDVMCDIDDGRLYKELKKKYPHVKIISLTANIDGANVFRSSHDSLWPVQLVLNCLPPEIRYLPENIIVTTLFYGKKKPNMEELLYHLAAEIDYLSNKLITVYRENELWNFQPVFMICSCDLPARTQIQNFKGTNAKFGCAYCYHPGIPIKNKSGRSTIRYIKEQSPAKCRTHRETLAFAQMADKKDFRDEKELYGVKGYSAALSFKDFDMISSFSIDFMHGIALGLTKDLVEIWIGKKTIPQPPYPDYKIKAVKSRQVLDKRIINFKPTMDFKRKPRSIFEISNYKASELLYLLFFYLRYALVGLLPTRVVKHFQKLASATYILCTKTNRMSQIRSACDLLIEFADEFEQIYGCRHNEFTFTKTLF